ncbi:DUF1648 domain-containing protein [Corynebacterium sp. p3-SID1145]|uniref:DUF1648 domain-containing protein n=1 Tax=unclassified Corynebacterium TaxID=2624378 RepID=UPI0021AA5908|nr:MULTISPECIES: DUF1648 domain-containing protein [unclassified Corynebacterium]MCT1451373.1 DUF1648 domain-containing protein [Corynebacterium sp. p3-SID1145]MCT1460619.1 DUF1648 domain-containing protein [Corynebacterium sp. p3-SID1140]
MNSRSLYGVALGVALLTFAVVVLRFDSVPEQIPTHIGPAGEVDSWEPKSLPAATFGAWYSLLLLALVYNAAPRPGIAYRRIPVSPTSPIPFSETAADKAAALLRVTDRSMAWIAVALVVPMCLIQLTFTFPGHTAYRPVALGLLVVGLIAAVIYTFVLLSRWPKQMEDMPTDDDELARQKHFGPGSGVGLYNEPDDPMVAWISPFNQSRVDLNWAHAPVKQYALVVLVLLVAVCVVPFLAL